MKKIRKISALLAAICLLSVMFPHDVEARRFWGWDCEEGGEAVRYIFWIGVETDPAGCDGAV